MSHSLLRVKMIALGIFVLASASSCISTGAGDGSLPTISNRTLPPPRVSTLTPTPDIPALTPIPSLTPLPIPSGKMVFSRKIKTVVELFSVKVDGSSEGRLTPESIPSLNASSPLLSSDGRKVVFISDTSIRTGGGSTELYIMSVDGSDLKKISLPLWSILNPRWSPDGSRIAFAANSDRNEDWWNIYTVNVDGSGLSFITAGSVYEARPIWSPDGKQIAFFSVERESFPKPDRNLLKIVEVNTGKQQTISDIIIRGQTSPLFSWSPNAQLLAFASEKDKSKHIYVFSLATKDIQRLTDAGNNSEPSWSPDGRRIAFTSEREGKSDIYVMNANGTDQRRVTNALRLNRFPSWSANGNFVYFASQSNDNDNFLQDIYLINSDGGGVANPKLIAREVLIDNFSIWDEK